MKTPKVNPPKRISGGEGMNEPNELLPEWLIEQMQRAAERYHAYPGWFKRMLETEREFGYRGCTAATQPTSDGRGS